MKHTDVIDEIKYSKFQALWIIILIAALFTPLTNLVKQGMLNRDYRWFLLFFFATSYVIWNFVRPTVFLLFGIPAVVITRSYIALSELGYDIDWKDIEEINLDVTTGRSTSYTLVISVKDPWKYISTIRNPVMRYYRWYAKDYFYKPFAVSLNNLEGDSQGIYDKVENHFHQYRRGA